MNDPIEYMLGPIYIASRNQWE